MIWGPVKVAVAITVCILCSQNELREVFLFLKHACEWWQVKRGIGTDPEAFQVTALKHCFLDKRDSVVDVTELFA